MSGGELWRVGHRGNPLAFTPFELCAWNHRFDDARRRFRTVYCAERPETSLREVLAEAGGPVALTDPAPEVLLAICREWGLELEPTDRR